MFLFFGLDTYPQSRLGTDLYRYVSTSPDRRLVLGEVEAIIRRIKEIVRRNPKVLDTLNDRDRKFVEWILTLVK